MRESTQSDQQADALRLQIEQLDRARRSLERTVDASRMALSRGVGARRQDIDWERRPGRTRWQLRIDRRLRVVSLVAVAVVMTAIYAVRPTLAPETLHRGLERVTQEHAAPLNLAEAAVGPTTNYTLVVHIRATRSCRMRMVVDGTPLEWRSLRPGDEFLSRPRQQLVLEADDGGALSATVNGARIVLAPDGHAIAVRLTTDRPFPEPVSVP